MTETDLLQLMGGPNGRGAPLREGPLGILEAQLAGIPPEVNDGRNQTWHVRKDQEFWEFWTPIIRQAARELYAPSPTPTPAPPFGIVGKVLQPALANVINETLAEKLSSVAPASPDIAGPLAPPNAPDPMGDILSILSGSPAEAGEPKKPKRK